MPTGKYRSWGNYPAQAQTGKHLPRDPQSFFKNNHTKLLPFGNGRSYGDVCLNPKGNVVDNDQLDHFINFCPISGKIECQGGVLLASILELVVPHGWFLAVTPGTKFITVGGAIANDVHGKNHHQVGSFGNHLLGFTLLRSDGDIINCSASENSNFFSATIGGLGLTGIILSAEIQLKPIHSTEVTAETLPFANLKEFFALSQMSNQRFEYTVAWVDCLAKGKHTGRGLLMRGNHSGATPKSPSESAPSPKNQSPLKPLRFPRQRQRPLSQIPFTPPFSLINRWTLRGFNALYYYAQRLPKSPRQATFDHFFYPLDGIKHWNRIYGPKGFLQHQCVIPMAEAEPTLIQLLKIIRQHHTGSCLAVLKTFGAIQPPGLLSFPRQGTTLAMDFPYRGEATLKLFAQLNQTVMEAGGALYPAKDATMTPQQFQHGFPRYAEFSRFIDPRFSSALWQRVMAGQTSTKTPYFHQASS